MDVVGAAAAVGRASGAWAPSPIWNVPDDDLVADRPETFDIRELPSIRTGLT